MTTVGVIDRDNDDVNNNSRKNNINDNTYGADPCLRLSFFISSANSEVQMGYRAIK